MAWPAPWLGRGAPKGRWPSEAADIDGDSAEARAGTARMLAELGQREAAIPEYRRAIELDPRSVESSRGLANALSSLGCFEEAILNYRRAI